MQEQHEQTDLISHIRSGVVEVVDEDQRDLVRVLQYLPGVPARSEPIDQVVEANLEVPLCCATPVSDEYQHKNSLDEEPENERGNHYLENPLVGGAAAHELERLERVGLIADVSHRDVLDESVDLGGSIVERKEERCGLQGPRKLPVNLLVGFAEIRLDLHVLCLQLGLCAEFSNVIAPFDCKEGDNNTEVDCKDTPLHEKLPEVIALNIEQAVDRVGGSDRGKYLVVDRSNERGHQVVRRLKNADELEIVHKHLHDGVREIEVGDEDSEQAFQVDLRALELIFDSVVTHGK